MPGEQVQEHRGRDRIGPVVEGEGRDGLCSAPPCQDRKEKAESGNERGDQAGQKKEGERQEGQPGIEDQDPGGR